MDYKYIQQLMDRYWQGATTLEEEQILRSFFSQGDVPEGLRMYAPFFVYAGTQHTDDALDDEFTERVLAETEGSVQTRARVVTWAQRFAPLFKAAAVVAIVLSISNAAQMATRQDTYQDVVVHDALSQGASFVMNDSLTIDTIRQGARNDVEGEAPPLIK